MIFLLIILMEAKFPHWIPWPSVVWQPTTPSVPWMLGSKHYQDFISLNHVLFPYIGSSVWTKLEIGYVMFEK